MKNRRSVKQIRAFLRRKQYAAMLEFNGFDAQTTTTARIRLAEHMKTVKELMEFVGGVREIRTKDCNLAGCCNQFFNLGNRQKYCSPACRQKAYRQRRKL